MVDGAVGVGQHQGYADDDQGGEHVAGPEREYADEDGDHREGGQGATEVVIQRESPRLGRYALVIRA